MLRFLSRFVGYWLVAAALVAAVIDGAKSIAASAFVTTTMAETWATLSALGTPGEAAAPAAPLPWPLDLALAWLLAAPTAGILALLGFLFLAAGRKPDSGAEARVAKRWGAAAEGATNGVGGATGATAGGTPAGTTPGPAGDDPPDGRLATLGRLGLTAAAPFAPLALAAGAPGGALARAAALAAAPRGKRSLKGLASLVDETGATFDGRLRIAAVDRRSGKRVMFGAPGAPPASVAQAVLASCAIPAVFQPVKIHGREYVDGGVWSPTNLDATPARRGTEVLCLNPTAALRPISSVSNAAALAESLALKARGARVRTIRPDGEAAEVMGQNLMDRRRTPDALAAGYAQGRALGG